MSEDQRMKPDTMERPGQTVRLERGPAWGTSRTRITSPRRRGDRDPVGLGDAARPLTVDLDGWVSATNE
jgi:hypothetical protein